jgi:hypothetical protein
MAKVACIGTREVEPDKVRLLIDIGNYLARKGYTISSGNATGADYLYAQGANQVNPKLVELHLPWGGYNREHIKPGNKIFIDGDKKEYRALASQLHPKWESLTRGPMALHARNVGIITGCCLVIALSNPKKIGGGGTGMGIRIAQKLGIKVLDLSKEEDLAKVTSKLAEDDLQLKLAAAG